MTRRCLIVADDLTGAADTGAQFASHGLRTFLISWDKDSPFQLEKFQPFDVLAINTDSRDAHPEEAGRSISRLLECDDSSVFPVIYKKIDSTLRGNIGYEIDALIRRINAPVCLMTPSYPEQGRTVVDGILLIGERPHKPSICDLLNRQFPHPIGLIGSIGLETVASGGEELERKIEEERRKGALIIVLDAASRLDLFNITEVAFRMKPFPLLAGSAGLAKEVARRLSRSASRLSRPERRTKPFGSIFIVSGSASSVTHQQLKCLRSINIPEFILPQTWVTSSKPIPEIEKDELSKRIAGRISGCLSKGAALLRSPEEYITADLAGFPVHRRLREALSSVVLSVLERSQVAPSDLVLILTGGDTAMGVIHLLQSEGIEIEEELSEGVMKGYLRGNRWDGLTVVTKAGAFGKKETLRDVVKRLEKE